jgi:hypothetical protein
MDTFRKRIIESAIPRIGFTGFEPVGSRGQQTYILNWVSYISKVILNPPVSAQLVKIASGPDFIAIAITEAAPKTRRRFSQTFTATVTGHSVDEI